MSTSSCSGSSSLDPRERFDLIIATNVLVYYDVFEQSLALANLATMMRRGRTSSVEQPDS